MYEARKSEKEKFLSLTGSFLILAAAIIVGSTIFTVRLPIASAQTTSPPIWPTIQHDFQRSSVASFAGPSSNSTDWIFGPTGSISSSPVIGSDGTIYFVDNNFHLFALNPDGSTRWEKTFTEGLFSPAIGFNGVIYVPGTRHLFAFYSDGDSPWTVPYNISSSRNSALGISPQGILFEVDSNGTLYAINPFGTVAILYGVLTLTVSRQLSRLDLRGLSIAVPGPNGTGAELKSISSNGQTSVDFPNKFYHSCTSSDIIGWDVVCRKQRWRNICNQSWRWSSMDSF